jgi:hypothetical protein
MVWGDQYVGLPFLAGGKTRAGIDCWGLVLLVWKEQCLHDFENLQKLRHRSKDIAPMGDRYPQIEKQDAKRFDAAIVAVEVATAAGWQMKEKHIGIVIDKGLILHIERDDTSCIVKASHLNVTRYHRVI